MAGFGENQEQRAEQYIAEGEKVLKKWTLFSSTTKNEDAAECFDKAARCYKVARQMEQAADCYERAAEQYGITKSAHDSAKCYVEAAKCRKTVKADSAVDSFRKAIDIYNVTGRFQQAGKMLQEVGEIHETEKDYGLAIEALEQAAEYLGSEGSASQANACLSKVAGMVSKEMDPPDLQKAAEIYERLGHSCMEKKLLAMNAKGYWLQTGLCLLAQNDTVGARNKQEDFTTADYTFDGSREFRFLNALIKCAEDLDVDGFSQQCFEYDQVIRGFFVSLLHIIRLCSISAGVCQCSSGSFFGLGLCVKISKLDRGKSRLRLALDNILLFFCCFLL
ncbi:unnamed protein product [Pylaiella littoralis]